MGSSKTKKQTFRLFDIDADSASWPDGLDIENEPEIRYAVECMLILARIVAAGYTIYMESHSEMARVDVSFIQSNHHECFYIHARNWHGDGYEKCMKKLSQLSVLLLA